MAYDYEKGWYVRLFTEETNEHRAKGVVSRGVRDTLLRYAKKLDKRGVPAPDSGELIRARSQDRALADLMGAMSTRPDEWDLVHKSLLDWIEDGWLEWQRPKKGWHALCIRNYVEAQTARTKNAVRQQRYRERKKKDQQQQGLPGVTGNATPNVTGNATPNVIGNVYRNATVLDQSKAKQSKTNPKGLDVTRDVTRNADAWCRLASAYLRDPVAIGAEHGEPHTWDAVRVVLAQWDETWRQTTNVRNSGDARVRVIVERFSEGRGPGVLIEALQAAKEDDWLRDKPKLHSPGFVFGGADRVDSFCRMADAPARKPARVRVQPDAATGYYEGGGGFAQTGWTDQAGPDDDEDTGDGPALAASGHD